MKIKIDETKEKEIKLPNGFYPDGGEIEGVFTWGYYVCDADVLIAESWVGTKEDEIGINKCSGNRTSFDMQTHIEHIYNKLWHQDKKPNVPEGIEQMLHGAAVAWELVDVPPKSEEKPEEVPLWPAPCCGTCKFCKNTQKEGVRGLTFGCDRLSITREIIEVDKEICHHYKRV